MYSRRSIWLGLVGLILLLFVIGWVIFAILNNSDDSKQTSNTSQSNSQSTESSNQSSQSDDKSTESGQQSSQQDVNNEPTNQPSDTDPAGDESDDSTSASNNESELSDTGSGNVFAIATIIAVVSAMLHRIYISRVSKI